MRAAKSEKATLEKHNIASTKIAIFLFVKWANVGARYYYGAGPVLRVGLSLDAAVPSRAWPSLRWLQAASSLA
jgi:hypothetical protein